MLHSNAITIRPATVNERDRLAEIAHAAKRHWGYPESWIAEWSNQLTPSVELLESGLARAAYIDGRSAAWFALDPQGRRIELTHMWGVPDWIGHGVGRTLFRDAVERAIDLGGNELEIASDPNAVGFYLQMGARRIGDQPAPMLHAPGRTLPLLSLPLIDPTGKWRHSPLSSNSAGR